MPDLKKNDIIALDITDMNNLGCGVGRYGGVVVFVRGAVTGDSLECRIIKVNKSYCVGRAERLLRRSPKRILHDGCTAPASCGGCAYRSISYEYELELKRRDVENAFIHAGLPQVKVGEVRSTGVISGYRNKAQYPVGIAPDGSVCAGFYATGTHRIAGGADCALGPEEFARIVREICRFATENKITVYDENTGRGLLRHIYLRRAEMTGEIMVCLVIYGDSLPDAERLCNELYGRIDKISGVLLNINKDNTNVVLGEKYVSLRGRDWIEDVLCGVRFRITPESFYQVNRAGAELLYGIAAERAGNGGTLLDLYCGTGTIGLSMAGQFDEVIGIEIVPGAVECARINAEINGICNASFYCGDASDAGGLLAGAERARGRIISSGCTVVIDPPRKGSTPELIGYLASRGIRRVVYVSCDCATLARDCALFSAFGYGIGEVTPVDMFPRTGHVETVVLMSRKEK